MISPRKIDKPLVLYGYGKLGHLAEEIFKELGIPIAGIMDKNKWIYSMPPRSPRNLKDISLLAVCVATEPYNQVIAPLIAAGWTDICPVWDIIEAYPEIGIGNGWFVGDLSQEDVEEMRSLVWNDMESKTAYLCFWMWYKYRKELPGYPVMEISTTLPSTLADIRERQLPIRFDNLPYNSDIDIHCEGEELFTIQENIIIFRKKRPEISCACYHSRDGLWEIEKFLMDNLSDYTWTFRLMAYMGQGAYIRGIPKEKI